MDFVVERIKGRNLGGRKVKQNIIAKSFQSLDHFQDCTYHFGVPAVKSNPDRIIINCGTNSLKMDESPELITEKTIELEKNVKPTTNEVVISSIIPRRDKLAHKGSKVNNIVENLCEEYETIKFMRQISFDARKHIGKDGIHLNNFGITQIVNSFTEFLNNG